jgi:NSS family neurotransmitter:Na+ symporter
MGQAFFTLSIGMGSIAVFGSYIGKDRGLLGEAATIISLDTMIAVTSGLIVFPACFTYNNGVTADAGTVDSSFLFTTLSKIFNNMPAGRLIGSLFFLFILFAALSTVIAVFENIMSFWLELTNLSRTKIAIINIFLLLVLSIPAAFNYSIFSSVKIFGMDIMGFEDSIVSNFILPFGSLVYVVFCTSRYGWGWKNFFAEVNSGSGPKLPKWIKPYMCYVLPLIIAFILIIQLF